MKISRSIIAIILAAAIINLSSCGSDSKNEPSPKDQILTKLSKTWKATSAKIDNVDVTSDYSAFQLTVSGTAGQSTFNYTTTGRPSGKLTPWNSAGTFTFATDFSTTLNRDDAPTVVTYAVSATQLQISFTYSGPGYTGRTGNVNGNWVFTFGL